MRIEIGKYNKMIIRKVEKMGAFLVPSTGDGNREVLLPSKEVPEGINIDDEIEVFIYKDSQDRIIATTKRPYGQVGELAYLELLDITRIGAFFDWGLDKDLFVPMREQVGRIHIGNSYLVKIYLDKTERLCATMRIDDDLTTGGDYSPGEMVNGTVYGVNPRLGLFVAIDDRYYGFVPNVENFTDLKLGDRYSFRVIRIRQDGRIDLSTRQLAHLQMGTDAEKILELLNEKKGFLPLTDKSNPEEIGSHLSMSKSAFKRALGRLLKEKKVVQEDRGIHLVDHNKIDNIETKS